jgi:preprotein translocase subunit SecE
MKEKNATPSDMKGSLPIPKSKRGLKGFYQETMLELKKVHWPTNQETTRLTSVVLVVCFGSVLALWLLGLGISALFDVILTGGN